MPTIQIQRRCHKTILVGPKLTGIIHLLELTKTPKRYSGFHLKSKIHFKKSFIEYLDYCTKKELIVNKKIYGRRIHRPIQSWFVITEKGRLFLEMVK